MQEIITNTTEKNKPKMEDFVGSFRYYNDLHDLYMHDKINEENRANIENLINGFIEEFKKYSQANIQKFFQEILFSKKVFPDDVINYKIFWVNRILKYIDETFKFKKIKEIEKVHDKLLKAIIWNLQSINQQIKAQPVIENE